MPPGKIKRRSKSLSRFTAPLALRDCVAAYAADSVVVAGLPRPTMVAPLCSHLVYDLVPTRRLRPVGSPLPLPVLSMLLSVVHAFGLFKRLQGS